MLVVEGCTEVVDEIGEVGLEVDEFGVDPADSVVGDSVCVCPLQFAT